MLSHALRQAAARAPRAFLCTSFLLFVMCVVSTQSSGAAAPAASRATRRVAPGSEQHAFAPARAARGGGGARAAGVAVHTRPSTSWQSTPMTSTLEERARDRATHGRPGPHSWQTSPRDCSREPLCAISEHGGVHGHFADFTEPLRRRPSHAQGLRRPSPHFDGPVRVTEWREHPACCVARG